MKRMFLEKLFLASKTASIKKKLCGIRQHNGMMLMDKSMIDAASGGALMDKTPTIARNLIFNMAGSTQQFGVRGSAISKIVNKNKEDRLEILKKVEALMMTRGRSIECGSSGNQNHGRSKSRRIKNLKCYNCGMREHLKKDCWHNKKNGGKNFEPSTSQGCVASTLDDGLILYSKAEITSKGGKQVHDKWIVDSGATWHMTPHRDWFHTYEPISGGSVFMGNNHALEIAGVGTVKIKMYDGTVRTIQGL
ncbi:hypothetical protein CR513_39162, partial [Mucuna pruriens]